MVLAIASSWLVNHWLVDQSFSISAEDVSSGLRPQSFSPWVKIACAISGMPICGMDSRDNSPDSPYNLPMPKIDARTSSYYIKGRDIIYIKTRQNLAA
jgi:hypothetical protein